MGSCLEIRRICQCRVGNEHINCSNKIRVLSGLGSGKIAATETMKNAFYGGAFVTGSVCYMPAFYDGNLFLYLCELFVF